MQNFVDEKYSFQWVCIIILSEGMERKIKAVIRGKNKFSKNGKIGS